MIELNPIMLELVRNWQKTRFCDWVSNCVYYAIKLVGKDGRILWLWVIWSLPTKSSLGLLTMFIGWPAKVRLYWNINLLKWANSRAFSGPTPLPLAHMYSSVLITQHRYSTVAQVINLVPLRPYPNRHLINKKGSTTSPLHISYLKPFTQRHCKTPFSNC